MKEKSNYCLHCKNKPCSQKGCPLSNQIPEFIEQVKKENFKEAYKILSQTTVLPGICGKICPHQKQCQGSCIRGIKGEPVSIGELEAFTFKQAMEEKMSLLDCWKEEITRNQIKNKGKKVAVIGSGPSGLTAAAFLAKSGVQVTIFERYTTLGGLLRYGIPEFRLEKSIVDKTIENILALGIKVEYQKELGKNLKLEELQNEYNAIFLGIGANTSIKMGVPGEELKGVFGGNELLEYQMHPNYEGKTVAVVGGGNVAMDCARTIEKLGAKEVKVIYRRAREQMPAEQKEIEEAKKEGIKFLFQNNIVKIIGKEKVEKVEIIKTELVKKEGETRLTPINIKDSNEQMEVDYIVMALGSKPAGYIKELGVALNKWGNIEVNEKYQTSIPNLYAGGDLAGVKGTVAWAAYSGREAAKQMVNMLEKQKN